jgi:hypothetical protein
MKYRPLAASFAAISVLAAAACSKGDAGSGGSGGRHSNGGATASGGIAGSGGKAGSGGSLSAGGSMDVGGTINIGGNTGAGGECSNGTVCGGEVVGTWSVTSSCLRVSGQMDMSSLGIGCKSAGITGSLKVTGTWSAKSDGTYSDNTVTTGDEQLSLPASCREISGTTTTCKNIAAGLAGFFDTISCTDAAGGGCACAATIKQAGWPGWVSVGASASGSFKTASNVIFIDDEAQYSYCVAGSKMTWSLKTPGAGSTVTGTIAFQSGSVPGSGGAGSGGASGKGGSTGAGGASAGGNTGSGGTTSSGGATGTGGSTSQGTGPCDIYAAANPSTPCVAAYSMGRVLYSKYTGPLYQVRKGGSWDKTNGPSGGTFQNIGTVEGGYADVAAQDAFCAGATCTVSILYDQSGKKNDLKAAPAGCYTGGDGAAAEPDKESLATRRATTLNGHKVYALATISHDGYRNNSPTSMVTGNAAQGVYVIADGKKFGTVCCWDFGNAQTNNCAGSTGTMDAIFFGTGWFGKGTENGPWFGGDFEAGVWMGGAANNDPGTPGGSVNTNNPAMGIDYAFGILKSSTSGNTGQYAIRTANAQSGSLATAYDGKSPQPWKLQGAIILGIGGDNSNWSPGTFFEGAITAGRPSDDTDALVLANAQAAKWGQ